MQAHDRSDGARLGGQDRRRLAAALTAARQARTYRRLEALLLVAEGHSVAEAARRGRVDRSSVHRWRAQYVARRNVEALANQPRGVRPRQADALTPQRLAAALACDPRGCGYRATSWTVPLLAHPLVVHDGIALSARTLRRRLHEAGYRWASGRATFTWSEPITWRRIKGADPTAACTLAYGRCAAMH